MKAKDGVLVELDGVLCAPEDARVSVLDRSFLFGDSVYETLRTYNGTLFALRHHLERLFASAERLRLEISLPQEELAQRCQQVVDASGNAESYCRVIISRGEGTLAMFPATPSPGRLVILVKPLELPPRALYESGVDVIIPRIRRNPPECLDPAIKSGNYLNNILAGFEASDAGAYDAVLLNTAGMVTEGTTSNVFAVVGEVVRTPPLSAGILEGVTRRFALETAAAEGFAVSEAPLPPEEFRGADECFLTSTMKEILPIASVDGVPIGDGKPGPITQRLAEALSRRLATVTG